MEHLSLCPSASLPVRAFHKGAVRQVVELVAEHTNIHVSQILNASRCRLKTARARQLAMYLAHVVLGESLTAIGGAFGRDRTTVSYACHLIEDMRDDVAFDAAVTQLEVRLQLVSGLANA